MAKIIEINNVAGCKGKGSTDGKANFIASALHVNKDVFCCYTIDAGSALITKNSVATHLLVYHWLVLPSR